MAEPARSYEGRSVARNCVVSKMKKPQPFEMNLRAFGRIKFPVLDQLLDALSDFSLALAL